MIVGPHSWNKAAPNGSIDVINDVLGVANQFGHTCPHTHGPTTPFGPHPTAPTVTILDTQTAPFAMSVGTTVGFAQSGQVLVDDGNAETMTYDQNSGACPGFNPATQFCVTVRGTGGQHTSTSIVFQKP